MEMEDGMSTASKMLETYPQDLGGIDRAALTVLYRGVSGVRASVYGLRRRLPQ